MTTTARPINATLAAEARKTAKIPVVKVTIGHHAMDVPFLDWTDIYDDGEVDGGQTWDACFAGDGSLNFIRVDRSNVEHRRIIDPADASQWPTSATPWRRIATKPEARLHGTRPVITAAVNPNNDLATPNAPGRNKRVQAFWALHRTPHDAIDGAHSEDYGVTWSNRYNVKTINRTRWLHRLAADMSTNTGHLNPRLFFGERERPVHEGGAGTGKLKISMLSLKSHLSHEYPRTWINIWRTSTLDTLDMRSMDVVNGPDPDDPTKLISYVLSTRRNPTDSNQGVFYCLPVGQRDD